VLYEGFGAPLAYPAFDPYVQQIASQISAASIKIAEGEKEQSLSDREASELRRDLQKVMNELDEARKDSKVDRKETAEIAERLYRLTAELNQKRINLETAQVPFAPYGPAAGRKVSYNKARRKGSNPLDSLAHSWFSFTRILTTMPQWSLKHHRWPLSRVKGSFPISSELVTCKGSPRTYMRSKRHLNQHCQQCRSRREKSLPEPRGCVGRPAGSG